MENVQASGPMAYQPYQPHHPAPTDPFAVVSLIFGILWIFWVGSLVAVICGHIALHRMGQRPMQGQGLAYAGITLGYIGVGTFMLMLMGAAVA